MAKACVCGGAGSVATWFMVMVMVMVIVEVKGSPPAEPVKCSVGEERTKECSVTNTYGSFGDGSPSCRATEVAYPSNEAELVATVASAWNRRQRMRVVSRWSHSIPKLVCPGNAPDGLLISTRNLTRIVAVDTVAMTVTAESGASLRQLIDAAALYGLALPHAPYWDALTLGGLLATGAHGSSSFASAPSAVHDYVTAIRLVLPNATVVTIHESHPDLDAARVSLGLLGVVSQVTLRLQLMFKRSMTNIVASDAALEREVTRFGLAHEFADFTWYPAQRSVLYRRDDRVAVTDPGNGVDDFIGFRPVPTAALALIRLAEEAEETAKNGEGKCLTASAQTRATSIVGRGFKNNAKMFMGYPIIGFQDKLQSSAACAYAGEDGLLTACPWDPRATALFFFQTTFAVPLDNVSAFIADVKALRQLAPKEALCGLELYDGILMRFVTASSAYLAPPVLSLDFDLTYYRWHQPRTPRLFQDVFEEIEQMGLFKYGGIPHWAKNRNLAFLGVSQKYPNFDRFRDAVRGFDPAGLMSNDWTDALLGFRNLSVVQYHDGCALDGLCICSADSHCAPHLRYFCRPGRVYRDARVCRYE